MLAWFKNSSKHEKKIDWMNINFESDLLLFNQCNYTKTHKNDKPSS